MDVNYRKKTEVASADGWTADVSYEERKVYLRDENGVCLTILSFDAIGKVSDILRDIDWHIAFEEQRRELSLTASNTFNIPDDVEAEDDSHA